MPEQTRTDRDRIASATEARLALDTARDLGGDYEAAVVESFVARLGDRIDDRVAMAFDEQLAERVEDADPLSRALARERRTGTAVVLASLALGTVATILSSGGVAVLSVAWTAIALIDIAYFFHRG